MSGDVAGGGRGYDEGTDSDGHGTDVAAVLLAARNDQSTLGIAYNATLLALRADRPGSCTVTNSNPNESGCRFADSSIAAGVDRAVQAGARVVNISLGGSAPGQVLLDAVNRATTAGVIIVVSAGNDGDSTDPAIDPNSPDPFAQGLQSVGHGLVIIAGSVDNAGVNSTFSNRAGTFGSSYLMALGEGVCCDYQNGVLRTEITGGSSFVFVLNGTSFSAPHVAGAAALLAQAFPNLSGAQIVNLLLTTARDAGATGTDAVYGRGIMDIARAFAPQGTTSLAGSTVAVPLDAALGTTSGPMGDAARAVPANGIVLDGYGRAYQADLGGLIAAAPLRPRLTPALAGQVRSFARQVGSTSVALSVRAGAPAAMPDALTLTVDQARGARLLAARVVTRMAPGRTLGFALSQGANELAAGMTNGVAGRSVLSANGAFLVADDALSLRMLGADADGASAMRLAIGQGMALTVASETGRLGEDWGGSVRTHARSPIDRQRRYARIGAMIDGHKAVLDIPVSWMVGASMINERHSLLGARLLPTLGGVSGQTLFADAAVAVEPAAGWRIAARWREGVTHAAASGLVLGGRNIRSRAWSIDAERQGVLFGDDALAIRVSQPLRLYSGALLLNLPVAYDYATLSATNDSVPLNLSPAGRERDVELAWRRAMWGGDVSLNAFWRNQPGHIATASDDVGVAVRFVLGM